jgi:hypothetical protein
MKLTPYDTGERLEPKTWVTSTAGLTRDNAEDFGKVDFDNEESATEAIVYIEKNQEKPGYTLRAYNMGPEPLRLALEEEDRPAVVIQPTDKLREIVQDTIDADVDPRVRDEVQVYYSPNNREALILVPGEKHVRKQLLISVLDAGEGTTTSAYVKDWASDVRETRL